ncbi:DUF262 domain-containing protein [Microbulbifer echini]
MSSIYAVFSSNVEQEESSAKYNPNLNLFEIYYDFESEAFLPVSEKEEVDPGRVVALRNIIDPIKLVDEIAALDKAYHLQAKNLSSVLLNYEIPVVQIKNRTKEEVGVIFERINNTGTKLNTLDLMTAWTWTEDFHLLDAIDELLIELEEKSFGNIDSKLVLQIVSGIIVGSTKTENVLRLTGERVRDNWDQVKNSVRATVDFLSTQIKCSSIEFLPFHQQLVPLARFYSKTKRVTEDQLDIIKRYFWSTSFSNRYSTGQTTHKMDADIDFIDKVADYDFTLIKRYSPSITARELIAAQFSKANPVTRAFLLLSAQHSPLDLANGSSIDTGKSLSSYNRKQYHHIFPNAFLSKQGFSKEQRFSVVNFCFLPADSNKKISSKSPSDYFFSTVPSEKKSEILLSNLLPQDENIYSEDNFIGFLESRSELIVDSVHKLVN